MLTAFARCRVASRLVAGVVRTTAPHLCAAPAWFPTLPPCQHREHASAAASSASAAAVGDLIRTHTSSDALALVAVHQEVRWTYQQLTSKVLSFAAALKDLGYKPGEKLCMALDNGAPNIVAQLAAAVVGADVVTVKTVEGLAVAVASHGGRGVLVDSKDKELAKQIREMCSHDPIIIGGHFDDVTDFVHYELLTMSYDPADAPALPVATSSYYYNSDKATPEATLLAQGAAAAQELRLTSADRLCVPVTLNHSMGFGFGCLAAWHAGAALVLPSPTPDAAATLAAVRDERCSILFADSHTLKALSDVQREQVPSLRGGLTKVGSGEAFGLGEPRAFAGVALVTVGKPPSQ